MKLRTGKECKKIRCKNFKSYSDWIHNLCDRSHRECMECKHAYVSQYVKESPNDQ